VLSFPPSVRVFVATFPVDMRKGIDSLDLLAQRSLGASVLQGHVVVAFRRRRDHVKVLWFDRGCSRPYRDPAPTQMSRPCFVPASTS
jgi:transposase